ncbi:MAG: tetratricopeptide repeat protein, partial [Chromatocurvus sp.]
PAGEAVDPRAAGTGPGRSDPAPADPAPPRESKQEPPSGDARSSLMLAALRARSAGDSSRAIALLERAQRIDPDNGQLYLELARTHFAAGNTAQGRAMAERGLLYCRREECAALRALIE